jgi:hypothetical protein
VVNVLKAGDRRENIKGEHGPHEDRPEKTKGPRLMPKDDPRASQNLPQCGTRKGIDRENHDDEGSDVAFVTTVTTVAEVGPVITAVVVVLFVSWDGCWFSDFLRNSIYS